VLRDEAKQILQTIATDMESPQTDFEQAEKSQGRGQREEEHSAAEIHSEERVRLGFNQVQVIAEYRALRATVIRLWMKSEPDIDQSAMDELIRFNESIDQALIESAARAMKLIEDSRDIATGVMAHDLRNPLNAIVSSAQLLLRTEGSDRVAINALATTILNSGKHMARLVLNLVDFTRTRLGRPLPMNPNLMDLEQICQQTIAEFRAAYPQRVIRLNSQGDLRGIGDATRLIQVLSNLLSNAFEYGTQDTPVTVKAYVENRDIVLQIHNEGPPISSFNLAALFDPRSIFIKKEDTTAINEKNHLGLGLFIAGEIVQAHSGTISVTSTAQEGTTFVVRLPLRAADHSA